MSEFPVLSQWEAYLESRVPSPIKNRLIQVDNEFTLSELKDMLQILGSHIATLVAIAGKQQAECHLLKETFKKSMSRALANHRSEATQVTIKEAEVLEASEVLQLIKDDQLESEACFMFTKSWVDAYEDAYTSISRIVSVELGEASLQTGRHP
jgi:Arc/MetJ family transcription regulator